MMKRIVHFLQEYGYLTLMAVCLVCSAALLWSVSTGRPLTAVAGDHMPVLRVSPAGEEGTLLPDPAGETQVAAPAGYLLTEQEIETRLGEFLPDTFPASRLDADLEDGQIGLSFAMQRADLEGYLESRGVELGFQRKVLLRLLPRSLEVEGAFLPTADANGLHLRPLSLELGDKSFDLQGLPEDVFAALDQGLNALLKSNGVAFTALEFTQDGLLLK